VSLTDFLRPGLRVVVTGTIAVWHRAEREHYYAGAGNQFWVLLHASGLVPEPLEPADDHRVMDFGVGLTDLVRTRVSRPGSRRSSTSTPSPRRSFAAARRRWRG